MHKHFSIWVVVAVGVLAIALLAVGPARADDTPTWASASQLYIAKVAAVSSDQIPSSAFASGNIDCNFVYETNCAVYTPYGQVFNSSLRVNDKWIPIKDYGNNGGNFIPIPSSDTAIIFSSSPVEGVNVFFNANVSTALSPQYVLRPGQTNVNVLDNLLLDGFRLSVPYERALADKSGLLLPADLNSMSFSSNGQWMIATDPDIATMRVNLSNGAVLPFGTGFTYGLGQNPVPKTAITSDGRYAVLASQDTAVFTIYDLSTCTEPPEHITTYVSCQSQDLMRSGFIQHHIPGYIGVQYLRFIDDRTINFYAKYSDNGRTKFAQYTLNIDGGTQARLDYLALGDSYISGEGAYDYLSGTDTNENTCHVSQMSYPLQLGMDLGYNSYHSVACSGATTNDLINASDDYISQAEPKTKRKDIEDQRIKSILTNFQPGYIDQLEFIKQYQPKAVTISIGGNDIGFSARLRSCLNNGTCYSTYEDRLEFVIAVNNSLPKIVETYQKVKNAGAANARIYVIGYPQIAKVGGNCADNVHMNDDELVFAQEAIKYLDAAIQTAAAKAGIFYVDTQDAFYGHRLCEAGPGAVAMNGITAGNDLPDKFGGPIGRESYHPNAYGHQLLEQFILSKTNRMASPMPSANLTATILTEASKDILNAPRANREANTPIYSPAMTNDFIYKGVPTTVNINDAGAMLAPGANFTAEIHSNPVNLGTYSVGLNRTISAQIKIPADIATGYHSLHFYGRDIANQTIDIYKIIYVAYSADDIDGNGVIDTEQKCVGVIASGNDYDHDGVDDSCDGDIAVSTEAGLGSSVLATTSTANLNANNQSASVVYGEPPKQPPHVLSAQKQVTLGDSKTIDKNLRLPSIDFIEAGLSVFVLATLSYVIKLSIF